MTKRWSILQDAKHEILQKRLEQVSGLMHIWQTDHYNMVSWLNQIATVCWWKLSKMRLNFYQVYIVGIYILPVFDEMQTMNDIGCSFFEQPSWIHKTCLTLQWYFKIPILRCSTIRASVFWTHPVAQQPRLISSSHSFDKW